MATLKPDYNEMLGDLPDDPGEPVHSDNRTSIQSYESTPVRPAVEPKGRQSRTKAQVKREPAEYIQRSLYAREDTFDRIREFAFKSRRPAQELYREGLFLLLKKYGLNEGISKPEDI